MKALFAIILIALSGCASQITTPNALLSNVDPDLIETRYDGAPKRDASGRILRRSAVIAAYKRLYPCPSTGLYGAGACPGWALNHDKPLACGGRDAVSNLSYMRNDVKKLVDSYEREINALNPPIDDTAACANKVQPLEGTP